MKGALKKKVELVPGAIVGSFNRTKFMAILLAVTWTLHHKFNVASIYTDCLNAIILLTGRFDSHYADNFLLRNLSYEIFKLTFCRITNVDHQNIHSSYVLLNGRWCPLLLLQLKEEHRSGLELLRIFTSYICSVLFICTYTCRISLVNCYLIYMHLLLCLKK